MKSGEMKRVSDSEETAALVPAALKPVEVKLAPVVPLIEIRDVPVAVRMSPL